jgi:hypothetical protein
MLDAKRRGITPSVLETDTAVLSRPAMSVVWGVLKLASLLIFSLALLGAYIRQDREYLTRADYTPGARYDIGPAQPDPTCPHRRWSVGDYMPVNCFRGQVLPDVAFIGLQDTTGGRHDFHKLYWVRSASDMLLVDKPFAGAPCRVWRVVRDRLAEPSAPTDTADYRQIPRPYVLGTAFNLAFVALYPMLFIVMVGFCFFDPRIGRRNPSS